MQNVAHMHVIPTHTLLTHLIHHQLMATRDYEGKEGKEGGRQTPEEVKTTEEGKKGRMEKGCDEEVKSTEEGNKGRMEKGCDERA